jgi:hypothetical protein
MANNLHNKKDTTTPILKEVMHDIPEKTPDEAAGLDISAKFRIFEPVSKKIIVEGRG